MPELLLRLLMRPNYHVMRTLSTIQMHTKSINGTRRPFERTYTYHHTIACIWSPLYPRAGSAGHLVRDSFGLRWRLPRLGVAVSRD